MSLGKINNDRKQSFCCVASREEEVERQETLGKLLVGFILVTLSIKLGVGSKTYLCTQQKSTKKRFLIRPEFSLFYCDGRCRRRFSLFGLPLDRRISFSWLRNVQSRRFQLFHMTVFSEQLFIH